MESDKYPFGKVVKKLTKEDELKAKYDALAKTKDKYNKDIQSFDKFTQEEIEQYINDLKMMRKRNTE
jgi:hypothetical protein